jgi:hypothetical protein
MKMLFSSSDRTEIKRIRKKLFEAGISCQLRHNPVAQGLFGIPSTPEIWIQKDSDILKALRLLGGQRLQQMTVIVPGS